MGLLGETAAVADLVGYCQIDRSTRYHWSSDNCFGQDYERMKLDHDHGRSRIYELVLNTQPYQAYQLEGNLWVAQLLVVAHVYGQLLVLRAQRPLRRR